MISKTRYLFWLFFISILPLGAQQSFPDIDKDSNGQLNYIPDESGNTIPDFSYAGYERSTKEIPEISGSIKVPVIEGDATASIQAAIDYVSEGEPDSNGFRGAVVLGKGTYEIFGSLYIRKSGVVLRGSGNSDEGTVLLGKGVRREAMIRVLGENNFRLTKQIEIGNQFVPLGATEISHSTGGLLKTGDPILIRKKLDQHFLDSLEMNDFGAETGWIGWKKEDWDIEWDREVILTDQETIKLSAPLTMSLDPAKDSVEVFVYEWPGRIEHIGIEQLNIKSDYHRENVKDEQHRWLGISIENARNVWVRRVNFENLAAGAVHIIKSSSQVTVEDCISLHPVSEIAAYRRHTFYTEGQLSLFQRCYSEFGYHDFAVGGYGTTGPNAFVQCEAHMPYSFSGAIGSWATGILFDIVHIDGNALSLANQGQLLRGAGWTAANSVIWESAASKMEVPSPPLAQNWAFGVWGQYDGDGHWKEVNSHISPRSLFYAQQESRLGTLQVHPDILDIGSEPSSSPTIEAAEQLTKEAEQELITLKNWILSVDQRRPLNFKEKYSLDYKDLQRKAPEEEPVKAINAEVLLKNGMLLFNDHLLAGRHMNVMWWRGSLRDKDVEEATPHITRFVPGRRGRGLTDNLDETVEWLKKNNFVSLNHNYGLWYDRRMDDHQRVRRYDTDSWPPYYEQPFERSGKGTAWDHLSKYDLTTYNKWYWSRLRRFAQVAQEEGELLFHQQYFQHNILEAGAHWSSSPWRTANNINNPGFPEPPPYAGDKRIFMAQQFYDVTNKNLRKLHEAYIEKSLENFKDQSNVIQFTSEEYTGPLHFMEFWLDITGRWEEHHQNKALIGLSATKDVQDAILQDKKREPIIDVIDIKYWYYRENGETYAPQGGKNLAPRQHARQMETGKESSRSVYRAIREYREKYPSKAVLYTTNGASRFGWAQVMAGASLPSIPKVSLKSFYQELPQMSYGKEENYMSDIWSLKKEGKAYLFYLHKPQEIVLDLSRDHGTYLVYVIDSETGEATRKNTVKAGAKRTIRPLNNESIFFIIKR